MNVKEFVGDFRKNANTSEAILERTPLELDMGICYTLGLERNKK